MIKWYLSIIFFILNLSAISVVAAESVPNDLLYGGNPIDSLCFFNQENIHKIHLKNCGIKKEKYNLKSINSELTKKGYVGYNWQDSASDDQGYSYYKILDAGDHRYWVYTINNSGGSGDFTNLYLVKRIDPTTLNMTVIAGGDRCNGGIQDVAMKNKNVVFIVNLTAYDLLDLANNKIKNLKAYDDLAACATCCTAKAFYSIDNTLKAKLNYAELENFKDKSELPFQGKLQACFNNLFVGYINKNDMILNQEKLNEFAKQFVRTCVAK